MKLKKNRNSITDLLAAYCFLASGMGQIQWRRAFTNVSGSIHAWAQALLDTNVILISSASLVAEHGWLLLPWLYSQHLLASCTTSLMIFLLLFCFLWGQQNSPDVKISIGTPGYKTEKWTSLNMRAMLFGGPPPLSLTGWFTTL